MSVSKALVTTLCIVMVSMPLVSEAKSKKSASLEEMWKIIQQQQQQIATLQEKLETQASTSSQQKPVAKADTDSKSTRIESKGPETVATQDTKTTNAAVTGKSSKADVERKTDILASEVEKLKSKLYIPDKREYKVEYGLGPAASEIYRVNRGLSIGGYGELFYSYMDHGQQSRAYDARAVIYVGYKFNDWILMNSEFEFENGSTGEGSENKGEVSNEFAYLDFMTNPKFNIRTGLLLIPMGFINEIHEGPTFHGNYRPMVEQVIIPTTWREVGVGVWGQLADGLQYRMYGVNGLNAQGFNSYGITEGRQNGTYALANNFAFTGRLDYYTPFAPGFLIGGSAWVGNSGQGNTYAGETVNAFTQLYEGHVQWHWRGFEMRVLGALGRIGNSAQLSAQQLSNGTQYSTVGSKNYGWYAEGAYDIMPYLWPESTHYLAPFVRYERYNTLAAVPEGFSNYGGFFDQWIYQVGMTYKPIENVAVKMDYRNINSAGGGLPPNQFNLGVAFMY